MLIAIVPLLVCVAGILLYALATNAKLSECGRLAYFVGLLWLVYLFAGKTIHLG